MKERPLSWMQRQFLEVLKDGHWHPAPAVVTGSGIRGLLSRGLIEHRNTREHMFSWVRDGEFRLKSDSSIDPVKMNDKSI